MFTGSRRDRPGYVVVPGGGREGGRQRGKAEREKEEHARKGLHCDCLMTFALLGECMALNEQERATGPERDY